MILQSLNLLDCNCLTSIFFKSNASLFEGSIASFTSTWIHPCYKLYVLTNANGLINDFEVQCGTIDVCPGQPDLRASGNIVMKFFANIPRHKSHKLFIDNWYTGVPLATSLMIQGIALAGTVRANRLRNCLIPSHKDLKKDLSLSHKSHYLFLIMMNSCAGFYLWEHWSDLCELSFTIQKIFELNLILKFF